MWLVPSLDLLLACSDIARTQLSSTRDRERVLPQVRAALEEHPTPSAARGQAFARQGRRDSAGAQPAVQPRVRGWDAARSRAHLVYIAAEVVKVAALLTSGVMAL